MAIVTGAIFVSLTRSKPPVEALGAKICRNVEADFILTSWIRTGTIIKSTKDKMVVEEVRWSLAPHDGKVSMALAYFCKFSASPTGHGVALIYGYRDNKIKASVVDGSYFSN